MLKPWEEPSPWLVCEHCGCEYNVEFEGNDYVCEVCLIEQEEEARLDELGE